MSSLLQIKMIFDVIFRKYLILSRKYPRMTGQELTFSRDYIPSKINKREKQTMQMCARMDEREWLVVTGVHVAGNSHHNMNL